ncbi:hypothetical protein [Paenibacillus sp. GCM10012303]|uniref:hypothetical protein n=1 Tax=Paenibacillus sp. GCM10012303 TaxID=3317340 RepID=UPI00360AF54C
MSLTELISKIGVLEGKVRTLEYEKQLLLDSVERAVSEAPQPMVVPRNVATALQSYRDDGHDVDYVIKNLIDVPFRPRERLKVLADFGRGNGYMLVCALVNGFVAESPDDRLRSGIKEILDKWDADTAGGVFPDKVPLTDRITEFVQGFYAAQ